MTDRELMQQALEALEANQPVNYCMNNNGEKFPMMQGDPFRFDRNTKAITTLRDRLAQPNDFNPDWDAMAVMVEEQQRMAKRIAELEAQPEQEPIKESSVTHSHLWIGELWRKEKNT